MSTFITAYNAADDVRLGAAERRKSKGGELRLELADVVAAKREIVDQIRGARAMLGVDAGGIDHAGSFELQHLGAEKIELLNQLLGPQSLVVSHFGMLGGGNGECTQVSLQSREWTAPLPVRNGGAGEKTREHSKV